MTEVLPNGNEVNSAKRYTYNPAGYLVKVEEHDSSSWNTQSEMSYNGLGERLNVTAYALGQSAMTQYVLDAQQGAAPLIASSGGNVTTYLYGLGPVAEKTTAWNYVLPDGSNTPRQLTNDNGEVTLSTRYNPWGDTLELNGTGNFTFGYFGGLMDEATGLIYVGNGQYYDPATGRFLTRDANPNSPNPYLPFDPTGLLLAPLGLMAIFYAGRKGKKSAPYVLMLVLMVVLPLTVGLACIGGGTPAPAPSAPNLPSPTATPIPGGGGNVIPGTPTPPVKPPVVPCPTPEIPIPIPTTVANKIILACGKEYYGECGQTVDQKYKEGPGGQAEAPLNPYYSMGKEKGYDPVGYEVQNYATKYDMAVKISNDIRANPSSRYILVGHSAGADAIIIAMDMMKNDPALIDGVILLDPSLDATKPNKSDTSISDMANDISARAKIFLGDTNEPGVGRVFISGADRKEYNYDHYWLAVANDVAEDAFTSIGR